MPRNSDPPHILILGGGLAGSAAAISARRAGAHVSLVEKSSFPRHKVCGEFLSPESRPVLEALGVSLDDAAPMRRALLDFAGRAKGFGLPETAWGFSRYRLDRLLFDEAVRLGATPLREAPDPAPPIRITAIGRARSAPRGRRQFGFKAHFAGAPVNDAVELYFFRGGYVGVNPVEGGVTNVCGLASESILRAHGFEIDSLIATVPSLRERLAGLTRQFDWLHVGPLVYANAFNDPVVEGEYPAGDALSFVDPFTGSGMLAALKAGILAGDSAARRLPADEYIASTRKLLNTPFRVSSLVRDCLAANWLDTSWVGLVVPVIPGRVLFHLTRPS